MSFQSRIAGRLLTLLAAFAAVLQWSVPQGWMISESADGSVILAPCPSTSPGLAALSHDAHIHAHHHHHESADAQDIHSSSDDAKLGMAESLCDEATVGVPALPPLPPLIADYAPVSEAFATPFYEASPGRGLAAPPPPSTGPPVLNI